jgi:hypothetical protein
MKRTAKELNAQLTGLWTMREVCDRFEISEITLRSWRNKFGLPTVVLPSRLRDAVRFIPEEIRAWMAQKGIPEKREPVARRLLKKAA